MSAYRDGELDDKVKALVEDHPGGWRTCPPLYASLVRVRSSRGGLRDPDAAVEDAVAQRIREQLVSEVLPPGTDRSIGLIVCIPVTPEGEVDHSWGRAPRVAVANVSNGAIQRWEEFDVGWHRLHDEGTEGGHHARIARFLADHGVEQVVASHMGPPMLNMLVKMGISTRLGASGNARRAVAEVTAT